MYRWWEHELGMRPQWKTVWRFLGNVKIELPYAPAITLLRIYPKKTRTLTQRDTCIPTFTAALFTKAKTGERPKRP